MSEPSTEFAVPVMPSDGEAEKRSYQRLPRTYPVQIAKLDFPMPKESTEAKCCDISKGGICVELPAGAFALGDTCQVKVLIPMLNKYSQNFFKVYENDAEQYFLALAEVTWVKPLAGGALAGFRFVNVHSDQLTALEKLIERAFAQE